MESSRRPKRVASLIKEALSRIMLREFQSEGSGLITVTRVEMTADLQSARVYLSVFGGRSRGRGPGSHRQTARATSANLLPVKSN